jgi:hypothetical protein
MENLTYWTTMAQVSATFTGLIFVGLVFYLEHINEAIKEIKQKFQVIESSSTLLNNVVLSSMILFALPLAISLTLILEGEYPTYQFLFRIILLLVDTGALMVTISLSRTPGMSLFSSNQNDRLPSIKRVNLRILLGNISLLFVIISMYVLILVQFWSEEDWQFSMMKVVAGISIGAGLFLSIFDLRLFNTNHIFFEVTEALKGTIKVREMQLQKMCRHAGVLLNNCCDLLGDKQTYKITMRRANQEGYPITELPGATEREQLFWQERFQVLRDRIPDQGHLNCTAFLFQKLRVTTLKELGEMGEEMEYISGELDTFQKEISRYIDRLKEYRLELQN